ncbi:MAG: hypothetical protein COB46_02060 [Rhodospirillaceae bacterium]|nr:MAG: hypothetical protein COB46_02060 [Rhodospirillaceae bacterium]
MSTLFHFRFKPEGSTQASALVIFCPQEDIVEQDLWDAINEDVGVNLRPDLVYFFVRGDHFDKVRDQMRELASNKTQWRIDPSTTPIGVISFDKHGQLAKSKRLLDLGPDMSKATFDSIKKDGVLDVFVKRNGLLCPGKTVHYIHPSGRHSRGFMRTANILIHGPEVTFLAMCLLQHLGNLCHYLWIDTSSIASIPYAMITLRQGMDSNFKVPTVNSFSSYDGLDKTRFERQEGSLVLISATTSGNLARRMIEKGFQTTNVVTLFSLALNSTGLTLLCDLSNEKKINPLGEFSATKEFTAADCPMCQEGSKPMRFVGDQFLADAISYEPYTILAADSPLGLSKLMDKYSGQNIFQIKASNHGDDSANKIWVDLLKLCSMNTFQDEITLFADRYVPLSTSLIVHLDTPGCSQLAENIRDHLGKNLTSPPTVKASKDISTLKSEDYPGGVVIVSSCIGSGASLQSVSQDLRALFKTQPRVYMAPFSKYSHTLRYQTLTKDLKHNSPSFNHEVAVLNRLVLPKLPINSSWARERAFLLKWMEKLEISSQDETLAKVGDRIETLSNLATGAANKLFWPSLEWNELHLEPTFAFWSTFNYADRQISQADVFITISSVLENLRAGKTPKVHHTSAYQTLLSPACFGRFNDGVIQASLLRIALPQELNYGATTVISEDMANLIDKMIKNWNNSQGEACIEFLIALGTKNMTLAPEHLHRILITPNGAPQLLTELINFCHETLLPAP